MTSAGGGSPWVERSCPAKINLTLGVLGRRPDGFHELDSIVARLRLADRLAMAPRPDDLVTLACAAPGVPTDHTNLVLRALRRLTQALGKPPTGLDIRLEKRIPTGAGLGGGSSDAAAAMALLNELWGLRWSPERLAELAAQIGSDVPLFLHGPVCRLRGRGERVEPLALRIEGAAALVLPPIHCDTQAVYRALDDCGAPPSNHAAAASEALARLAPGAVLASRLSPLLVNDLLEPAFTVAPPLRALHAQLSERAGGNIAMSGSGSALYRLFDSPAAAAEWAEQVRQWAAVRVEVTAFEP